MKPATFVRRVYEDLRELPPQVRSSPAARTCRRFVRDNGRALAGIHEMCHDVLYGWDNSIIMVVYSRVSKRLASFEFRSDDDLIRIILLDEKTHRKDVDVKTITSWLGK